MNKVYLHGHLADMFGEVWQFEIKTAAEAIRAMEANCPGFLAYLKRHSLPGYHVVVGDDPNTSTDRSIEELQLGIGDKPVHIFPAVAGSGGRNGGWTNVIVGALFIVAGALATSTWFGAPASGYLYSMGFSMILGGVAALLTRPPSLLGPQEDKYENTPSYLFDGPVNTQAQGHPVPVGYGMLRIGGAVISTSFVVEDFTPGTQSPNDSGFRITNYPSYNYAQNTDSTVPLEFGQELHAAGGTPPYTFTLVSQTPGTYFHVDSGAKSYLIGDAIPEEGTYTTVVRCTDSAGLPAVEKEIQVNLTYAGWGDDPPPGGDAV